MLPWQERVVQEKKELDTKIEYLMEWRRGLRFDSLADGEKFRLQMQLDIMEIYSDMLGERIRYFE